MDPHAAIWEHCLAPAGLSDIGLRRSNNQDSLAILLASSQEKWEDRGHLFVVADGMGAHAAGELASKLATDIVPLNYAKFLDRPPIDALLAAVRDANSQIHSRGMANDDFRGMGTTVSALVLSPQGSLVAHVGDSRVYRQRGTKIEQLTFDHSLVWELRAKQGHSDAAISFIPKNIITRSLGPNPQVQVDLEGPHPIQVGDTYLLCSDGLSGQVKDEEIGKVLAALPPKEAVQALVDLANLRGGPDNITVIVVRVLGPQVAQESASSTASRAAAQSQRPAVHPAVWSAFGVLALSAAMLVAVGQRIAALAALLGVFLAGGVAILQKFGGFGSRARAVQRFGRGPYVTCDCTPDASFATTLAELDKQLREAAANAHWRIDWDSFCRHESAATAAVKKGKFPDAVREYCRAISCMMEQLRHQSNRKR